MVRPCRFFTALLYSNRTRGMAHLVKLINIAQPTSGKA